VAKYLREVHQKEEMEDITITIVYHHTGQDSNLKMQMNYFKRIKKACAQAGYD